MNKKKLITIVGPTAIGKTALSLQIAQHYNTEIISADSRQFFKEMRIGTAAPSAKELAAAPHHFIGHLSIDQDYSVGDFEREALKRLEQLFEIHDTVVLVGGSGLYVDAVTKGLDNFPPVDPDIREALNQEFKDQGLEALQKKLQKLDPDHYKKVDLQNPHRLIRALEICIGTGTPYSSFIGLKKDSRPFQVLPIGLSAPRPVIYDRINRRVDQMMDAGLLEEVKLLSDKQELNALNTVGYKELFGYLNGHWTLERAVDEIKKNSRRFAKRQLTWFKKDSAITWFDHTTPTAAILEYLSKS